MIRDVFKYASVVAVFVFMAAVAYEVDMRVTSRQVVVAPRSLLTSSNLSEAAAAVYNFRTNIPAGMVSATGMTSIVQAVVADGMSNVVANLIDSGSGLRFSTTGFYQFASGQTVSVYDAVAEVSSVHTVGLAEADIMYISDADFAATISTSSYVTLVGDVHDLNADVLTVGSGYLSFEELNADTVSVIRTDIQSIAAPTNEVTEFFHTIYRGETRQDSYYSAGTSNSVVPPVQEADSVYSITIRLEDAVETVVHTNILVDTYDVYFTNAVDSTVYYTNDVSGYLTNIMWEAVSTNEAATSVITNYVYYDRAGDYPEYTFTWAPYYKDWGGGHVSTSYPWTVDVTEYETTATNIIETPFYSYTNAYVTVTNPTPFVTPDHGYIGVATTSIVDVGFAPGVLRTNAAGRCYINEPDAVQPAGSGTKADPFIMVRPENFRWVRENHTPGGLTGEADVSVSDFNDNRKPYLYEDPPGTINFGSVRSITTYKSRMMSPSYYWATNGMMDTLRTFCVQTNDIDMLQTYLWNYNQFTNAPFVTGFPGISGVSVVRYAGEFTNQIPSQYVYFGSDYSKVNAVTNTMFHSGSVNAQLRSFYAARTWPNKRWIHQIHYDGRGNSLGGIWVNGGGAVVAASRGLLGAVSVAPTVVNLEIGGCIKGDITPGDTYREGVSYPSSHRACSYYGGLFGTVISEVCPVWSTPYYDVGITNIYEAVAAFSAPEYCIHVSNCVAFADIDTGVTFEGRMRETTRTPMLYVGGLFGTIHTCQYRNTGDSFAEGEFKSKPWFLFDRPAHIYNSSILGQRLIYSPFQENMISCGRISGAPVSGGFNITGSPASYEDVGGLYLDRRGVPPPFGVGNRVYDNIFLNNTFINIETNYTRVNGANGRYGFVHCSDGVDVAYKTTVPYAPTYLSPLNDYGELLVWGDEVNVRYVLPLTMDDWLSTDTRGSRLGYYGSMDITAPRSAEDVYDFRVITSIIGNYGASISRGYNKESGGAAGNTDADLLRLSKYQVVAGLSAHRVIHRGDGPTDSAWGAALISIDGTGVGTYTAQVPYSYKYIDGSAAVVDCGLLRDEQYDSYWNRERVGFGNTWESLFSRFSTPDLRISGRSAMTKPYVIEPANDLGGGEIPHDASYPYSGFDDSEWTRPGELDGWYPAPAGAAGLDFIESASVTTSGYNVVTNDLGGGFQEVTGSWDVVTSEIRDASLLYTNYYAIDDEYVNSLTCRLTVVSQVYSRESYIENITTSRVSVVVTNQVSTYTGVVTVAGSFIGTGSVTPGGEVYRTEGDYIEPWPGAYTTAQEPNEYGMFRVLGSNVTAVATSSFISLSSSVDNHIAFSDSVHSAYVEWWPDNLSTTGLSVWVTNDGVTDQLDGKYGYCEPSSGDVVGLAAPIGAAGFAIVRPGHPTNYLSRTTSVYTPDVRWLATNAAPTQVVFQVSFAPSPEGPPVMMPAPGTLWTDNVNGTATNSGEFTSSSAYIDGTNIPYSATLRVDIYNPDGAGMNDVAFFGSVQPYCNYSSPQYLKPGGPHYPVEVRTSDTEGYRLYSVYVRQLVVFHARGSPGTSATFSLIPEDWPYD